MKKTNNRTFCVRSGDVLKVLLMLKFILILVLVSSLQCFSKGFAQGKISLNLNNVSLKKAFKEIEKRFDYHFLYNDNLINATKSIDVKTDSSSIDETLGRLLTNTNLTYQITKDKLVIISRKGAEAQAETVTGVVTDEKNLPLAGVSVRIKGASTGTVTDVNGRFSLSVANSKTTVLEFTYVSFVTQDVALNGRTRINVVLKENIKSLSEIVVVGYNVVKKSDVTGAVGSVTAEEIRSRPVSNALEAIQGKVAGVDITSNERPGQVGSVLIRGARSLTATNGPLYVVDGVPLSSGGIEAINPNDIETIDILKDASATAIYGSRGANGVIVVTTKRGKSGRLDLEYTGTTTVEKIYDRTQMMNAEQYIAFRRDAFRRINYLNALAGKTTAPNTGYSDPNAPNYNDDQRIFAGDPYALANVNKGWVNGAWNGNLVPTTNWTGMVTKVGVTQNHTLSVSGGTDKIKAYGSFGYLYQDGTQKGENYTRYSGNFSVDITPVKWFSMGGSINATYSLQNYGFATTNATGPGSFYAAAQGMLPYAVPYDSNGKRIDLPGGDINILNPIGEDQYDINLRKVMRALGSFYGEITFMKGLKYRLNFGPDFYNLYNGRYMDAYSINRGGGQPGSTNYAQLNQTNRLSWTLDHLLYFDRTFGKHQVGLTLLASSTSFRDESSAMTATNLPWTSQLWYQLNSVSALDSFGSNLSQSSLESYMGRFNYSFNSKYLLTASGRWDGASQLAPGHKWDFFPSVALAWRLEQEDFIRSFSWIDQLKLRIGVGSTGNAAVPLYSTEGRLQTLYYTYGSSVQAGYVASDASLANPIPLPNQNLGWEHTTQVNLGLDFAFLKNRISGSLDLYTSKTTGLLEQASIPTTNGYPTSIINVGATANHGVELVLNTENICNNGFRWNTTLSFGANKEHITKLVNGDDINNLWFIGQRIAVYYDYVKTGIWQNTPQDLAEMAKFNANGSNFTPGTIRVKDLNGDYKIDANHDRTIVGHAAPDWTGGITNTFSYKNFELSAFILARWGFTVVTGAESLQGRYAQRLVNYWTPTNPTNDYPAPNYNSAAGDPYRTSMNYQDGSFVKIRNISLGYFLPSSFVKKIGLSWVKVYVQAVNPGLIYSNVGWIDPDTGLSTFNRGLVMGLNVGF